ncbi:MAG: ABC transporter ATP-binding protein [Bacteroidales bacterium]|jgi:ABC-2 type transport system ATP-binding protein|nr:ABC transporter ATP-binding protein [Bacteroidales bacterium]MDD4394623.1 ABC transporter ATP-binding protein [Bacteroidales bacterium]
MISIDKINFSYSKRKTIFNDLSLELPGGHIYGLLGKNGAGKTTLLKVISGLCFPKCGNVEVMDFAVQWRHPDLLKEMYYLSEELYVPAVSIKNYIRVNAPFYPNFSLEQMYDYLKAFEIEDDKQLMTRLSHGQKKKIMICFALATNTKILLMDEPTNGLDIPSKSIFRKVMAMAADENRLFLISTHQVRDLHSLIDTVIILDDGEIVLVESVDSITHQLLFKVVDSEFEVPNPIYSEDSLRGIYTITENVAHEECKLDIELFFNAVLCNKERIRKIFKY